MLEVHGEYKLDRENNEIRRLKIPLHICYVAANLSRLKLRGELKEYFFVSVPKTKSNKETRYISNTLNLVRINSMVNIFGYFFTTQVSCRFIIIERNIKGNKRRG